ncbi:MAG: DUF29 domain-containing protein [Cyanophyceae cyanobacterium]
MSKFSTQSLYEQDFHAWLSQAALDLYHHDDAALDWENLAEEIDGMVKSQKRAIASNTKIVILHLLKWKYQPAKRSNSWLYTIAEHRERIEDAIVDSPSLKKVYEEGFEKAYDRARRGAAIETGMPLNVFPPASPFTREQVIDPNFLPQ